MLKRLKKNFDKGLEKIRWFSSVLSERIKIEFLVIKLLLQSDKMEKKRDELLNKIGQRVYELKENTDRHVLKDRVIGEALNEIEQINSEIETTKKKAAEISGSL
jgi:hypothetical protein